MHTAVSWQWIVEARDQVRGMEAYVASMKQVAMASAVQLYELGAGANATEEGRREAKRLMQVNLREMRKPQLENV